MVQELPSGKNPMPDPPSPPRHGACWPGLAHLSLSRPWQLLRSLVVLESQPTAAPPWTMPALLGLMVRGRLVGCSDATQLDRRAAAAQCSVPELRVGMPRGGWKRMHACGPAHTSTPKSCRGPLLLISHGRGMAVWEPVLVAGVLDLRHEQLADVATLDDELPAAACRSA